MYINHIMHNFLLQVAKDGRHMKKRSLINFVQDLIRENKSYIPDGYSLHVVDLSQNEKRLFLAHIVDAYEFEHYCENAIRLSQGIEEYSETMQRLIDENISDVYNDDCEERKNDYNEELHHANSKTNRE